MSKVVSFFYLLDSGATIVCASTVAGQVASCVGELGFRVHVTCIFVYNEYIYGIKYTRRVHCADGAAGGLGEAGNSNNINFVNNINNAVSSCWSVSYELCGVYQRTCCERQKIFFYCAALCMYMYMCMSV